MSLAVVLWTSGSKMFLWLQRAWWGDLRAAVIRGFKNIDVYKTPARIIFFAGGTQSTVNEGSLALYSARTP